MMPARQAYAPTPHSFVPSSFLSATINLDEEVKLAETPAERELHDNLAELFSIIVTIEQIEKAFLKDAIPENSYAEIIERNLKQYKALLADETVARAFGSLKHFTVEFDIDVPRATERIRVGMPSTVLTASSIPNPSGRPGTPAGGGGTTFNSTASGVMIAEATQDFITFLDALRLGLLAKDQLHPLLTDVIQSVNRVTDRDFDSRGKIVQWLIALNQMKATEELSAEQARELELDINSAYQGFKTTLS